MSKFSKLSKVISKGRTLLGVGPMSWNCIDSVIEIANEKEIPLVLIASRRQVECQALGGGYVTTTEKLGEYVRQKDKNSWVFLARDHGGPWQGDDESDLEHSVVMDRAKQSYDADVKAGFDIIHIDPSLKKRQLRLVLEDVRELYHFCDTAAAYGDKQVIYEVGTEEHNGNITDLHNFNFFVNEVKKLNRVKFVVGNTGLWVKETENVGLFDRKRTKEMVKVCNQEGLFFKAHNTDYFSSEGYELINEIGVHSINVAPQYGVRETRVILDGIENDDLKARFIEMAIKSGKWQKWLRWDWDDYEISDENKVLICGHYIFNEFFDSLPKTPRTKGVIENFNSGIKVQLKNLLCYHLRCLGWKIT